MPIAECSAERARLVRRSGDHAAAGVAAQRRERPHDVVRQRIDVLGRLMPSPAADDDGLAAQLGIAQQFDGRIERIHVEMRDVRLAASHGCTQSEIAEHQLELDVLVDDVAAIHAGNADEADVERVFVRADLRHARQVALAAVNRSSCATLVVVSISWNTPR